MIAQLLTHVLIGLLKIISMNAIGKVLFFFGSMIVLHIFFYLLSWLMVNVYGEDFSQVLQTVTWGSIHFFYSMFSLVLSCWMLEEEG